MMRRLYTIYWVAFDSAQKCHHQTPCHHPPLPPQVTQPTESWFAAIPAVATPSADIASHLGLLLTHLNWPSKPPSYPFRGITADIGNTCLRVVINPVYLHYQRQVILSQNHHFSGLSQWLSSLTKLTFGWLDYCNTCLQRRPIICGFIQGAYS